MFNKPLVVFVDFGLRCFVLGVGASSPTHLFTNFVGLIVHLEPEYLPFGKYKLGGRLVIWYILTR